MSKLYPYIRGTGRKYGTPRNGGFWGENGYNCIEVGYIEVDDDGTPGDIIELTPCADVVDYRKVKDFRIDCVGKGYLRLFTDEDLMWRSEELPLSNMTLVYGTSKLKPANGEK